MDFEIANIYLNTFSNLSKIQLNISGNETQALKEYLKWLRARRPPAREKNVSTTSGQCRLNSLIYFIYLLFKHQNFTSAL